MVDDEPNAELLSVGRAGLSRGMPTNSLSSNAFTPTNTLCMMVKEYNKKSINKRHNGPNYGDRHNVSDPSSIAVSSVFTFQYRLSV